MGTPVNVSEWDWQGSTSAPEQTVALGAALAGVLQPGDLLALVGELGAGKTQLVRGLAQGLHLPTAQVSSPTFVLMHEYEPDDTQQPTLVHIDAYRLRGPEELPSIGWDADSNGTAVRSGAVVAIEWADRLGAAALGADLLWLELTHAPAERRRLRWRASGTLRARLKQLQSALTAWADAPAASATPCPICKQPTRADNSAYPFCSPRCRMVDLGKWLNGDYLISRPIEQSDLDEQ